jgi:hypothetical protein
LEKLKVIQLIICTAKGIRTLGMKQRGRKENILSFSGYGQEAGSLKKLINISGSIELEDFLD